VSIKNYEEKGRLLNVSFVADASAEGVVGFRGRLALVDAEIGDESGNTKPPAVVMEHVVLMSTGDKLTFAAGSLDKLAQINDFVAMYKDDFAPDMKAMMYVVDLTSPLQIQLEGVNFALIPMQEGITWNELLDEAGLDKRDLKSMSSGDKVYAVYEGVKDYKPKGELVTLEEALAKTDPELKRPERGAL
jgi:hypothetical protein